MIKRGVSWQPFDMEGLCACCGFDFTWSSTSHSPAQQVVGVVGVIGVNEVVRVAEEIG